MVITGMARVSDGYLYQIGKSIHCTTIESDMRRIAPISIFCSATDNFLGLVSGMTMVGGRPEIGSVRLEEADKIWAEVADNTYRDGSSELNNTEASFVKDGGVSVDQRKMNAGESRD